MAFQGFLGKDQFAVDRHFKGTTLAGDQRPGSNEGFDLAFPQNFLRQTDGTRCILSNRTIFKGDVHQTNLHDTLLLIDTR